MKAIFIDPVYRRIFFLLPPYEGEKKGFAYVFNVTDFHYAISCKIAIRRVSAEKSH